MVPELNKLSAAMLTSAPDTVPARLANWPPTSRPMAPSESRLAPTFNSSLAVSMANASVPEMVPEL